MAFISDISQNATLASFFNSTPSFPLTFGRLVHQTLTDFHAMVWVAVTALLPAPLCSALWSNHNMVIGPAGTNSTVGHTLTHPPHLKLFPSCISLLEN